MLGCPGGRCHARSPLLKRHLRDISSASDAQMDVPRWEKLCLATSKMNPSKSWRKLISLMRLAPFLADALLIYWTSSNNLWWKHWPDGLLRLTALVLLYQLKRHKWAKLPVESPKPFVLACMRLYNKSWRTRAFESSVPDLRVRWPSGRTLMI